MDYDATDIPVGYDRGRNHGPEVLDLWMNVVASHVEARDIRTILDLGCGTGRFTEALAVRFDAEVIGIDPSNKMLEQARSKQRDSRIRYEIGRGESIPLPDVSVDLIFMSMVLHHFDDQEQAVRECRRVLRRGGSVFLRAGVHDRIPEYPYVDFFPETLPILETCLPTSACVCEVFEKGGFQTAARDVVKQEIARNFGMYADKLSAGADSVLVQLNAEEFAAGMQALRSHATLVDDQPVSEPIDVFVFK